jgi:capsular polysaccharide export protein
VRPSTDARRSGHDWPPRLYAVGFSGWKRPLLRTCFAGSQLRFVDRPQQVPEGESMVLWGRGGEDAPAGQAGPREVLRVEDGFLRSVGLGADLTRPLSWVVDRRGIHFDAGTPSDLEQLLARAEFGAGMLERAGRLRERIVAAGLTKYNVGGPRWRRPPHAARIVLVPGQVESDASIAYGAAAVRTNIALLRAVREARPGDYLVYKPHPDVAARLRTPGAGEAQAHRWCDEVLVDARMSELLDAVDEVHVMTSLAGFEALLRGKAVTCYGRPFYAGWGLTCDMAPLPRRMRRLDVDQLTAGALIAYPLYFSRDGRRLIEVEEAIEEMVRWNGAGEAGMPWWRELRRIVLRRVVGVR